MLGRLAQLVERTLSMCEVKGSKPLLSKLTILARIAQSVERTAVNREVSGSNPDVSDNTFLFYLL